MPLFALLLIISSIRNVNDNVINSLTNSTNHGTIVALVLTGMWITIGIFLCDVLACSVVSVNEYSSDIKGRPINLYITFGTLVSDMIFILPMLLCILYIGICYNGREVLKRFHCNMVPPNSCWNTFFACIVGRYTFKKISKLTDNSIISLMFPFMLITPILCISSHIGYIMLAWLTEPTKCNTAFILYYIILVLQLQKGIQGSIKACHLLV